MSQEIKDKISLVRGAVAEMADKLTGVEYRNFILGLIGAILTDQDEEKFKAAVAEVPTSGKPVEDAYDLFFTQDVAMLFQAHHHYFDWIRAERQEIPKLEDKEQQLLLKKEVVSEMMLFALKSPIAVRHQRLKHLDDYEVGIHIVGAVCEDITRFKKRWKSIIEESSQPCGREGCDCHVIRGDILRALDAVPQIQKLTNKP